MKIITLIIALSVIKLSAAPFPTTDPTYKYGASDIFPRAFYSQLRGIVSIITRPGDARMWVVKKGGVITVITNLTQPTSTVFLDVGSKTWTPGEAGLHGLAFHPNFAQNGLLFTFGAEVMPGNTNAGINRLIRWRVDPLNPNRVDPSSRHVMIEQPDHDPIHQGGDIKFGPDGFLYLPLGDEGRWTGTDWATTSRQWLDRDFFSAILRLDVDGKPGSLPPNPHPGSLGGYWIPKDNPFIGATSWVGRPQNPNRVRTEFWAVGVRNPHRVSFIPGTTNLVFGDVGDASYEKVAVATRGAQMGWPFIEGTNVTKYRTWGTGVSPKVPTNVTEAIFSYPHKALSTPEMDPDYVGNCIIGGFVYTGNLHPDLKGKYLCADFVAGHLWAINLITRQVENIGNTSPGAYSFGLHPLTGDVLLVSQDGIFKLTKSTGGSLPATLSATGLFKDVRSLTVVPEMVPYSVAVPFWSDYAIKSRWVMVPQGKKIQRNGTVFSYPVGTIWMKHFNLEEERGNPTTSFPLETRFTVKTATGVYGFGYRWRLDRSDADLIPAGGLEEGIEVVVNGKTEIQQWHYPSRSECLQCHNSLVGGAPGFNVPQLNSGSQLIGMSELFEPPFSKAESAASLSLSGYGDESATLEWRVKSYVAANCAQCHQTGGVGQGSWNASADVPFAKSGILGGSVLDELGVPGSSVIAPGSLEKSVMYRRVATLDLGHMPPLGTSVINQNAVSLLQRYIAATGRKSWSLGVKDGKMDGFTREMDTEAIYRFGDSPDLDDPWSTFERALTTPDPVNKLEINSPTGGPAIFKVGLIGGFAWDKKRQAVVAVNGIPAFQSHQIQLIANGQIVKSVTVSSSSVVSADIQMNQGQNILEVKRATTPTDVPSNAYGIRLDYVDISIK